MSAPHREVGSSSPLGESSPNAAPRPAVGEIADHRVLTRRIVGVTDLVIAAGFAAIPLTLHPAGAPPLRHVIVTAAVAVVWLVSLRLHRPARQPGANGLVDELRSVGFAALCSLSVFGVGVLVLDLAPLRGAWTFLFTALLILAATVRLAARRMTPATVDVLLTGNRADVTLLGMDLADRPRLGYRVVGAYLVDDPDGDRPLMLGTTAVPVFDDAAAAVAAAVPGRRPTAVMLASASATEQVSLREIAWQLDELDLDMILVPAGGIGSSAHLHTATGRPALHFDRPRYRAATAVAKRLFDVTVGSILLIVAAPVLLICAAAVKLGDGGPVFYRAARVGRDFRPFGMWKFRSMVVGADRMRDDLDGSDGNEVLFKMHADPRVTRVGRILRRFSLDELPQLFNVIDGSMSLVGPRPPLADETKHYDELARRRMLVRPGMTGLWQVSGRSDLSWQESIHLDLRYLERWSLAADLSILFRTVRAVVAGPGAY